MDENLVKIRGSVEDIRYSNEETGYTVLEIEYEDELLTVVGKLPFISVGEEISATGKWVMHKTYGRQFQAEYCEKTMPADVGAILKYLSSGSIKGIGPVTAQRIVDLYGEKSLEVIENEPEKIAELKGISLKKAKEMSDSMKEQFGVRSLMLFFQQYGITPVLALKIWKKWGGLSTDKLRANPYLLCEEISGVGFLKSDEIASKMGISPSAPERIRAGIKYVLSHNSGNGHTFLPREKLVAVAAEMLQISELDADVYTDELVGFGDLVEDRDIEGRDAIYLRYFYEAEEYTALRLASMLKQKETLSGIDRLIAKIEEKNKISYAELQKTAIKTAVTNKVMLLTGGPGTGKTTTLRAILDIFEEQQKIVALCAPTGRAAKRMEELSGREAKTIHRLLEMGYSPEDGGLRFNKNDQNMLDCDVIIVDEISMVDVLLMQALLKAMTLTTKLIMVGDADQLPPVGAGNVLKDLLKSQMIPYVSLNVIFRQATESLIVVNAHKIIKGEMPELTGKDSDFFFLRRFSAAEVSDTITELVVSRLPKAYGFSPLQDIQVLCPSRKTGTGTELLNICLRDSLNPPSNKKKERQIRETVFREGDKVMQTKNNYDIIWDKKNGESGTGVFNGDIGILEELDTVSQSAKIRFDDRTAFYAFDELDQLEHAYAITVHKSQGNEFSAVIIPVFDGSPKLFYRNLLYTAVTRARQLVILVGSDGRIGTMVSNVHTAGRFTGLSSLLQRFLH